MISEPPILRIRRDFPRPPAGLVAELAGTLTGHAVDAMGGGGALDHRIKPIDPGAARICGIAVTCHNAPADNLGLFAALDVVRPGDVIVAAAGGHLGCALTGDLLVGMARNCGAAAIVTDGAVRDVAGILAVGLPVFCAGVTPDSPVRNGPGSVGLPVVVGGISVSPGDIVIGDADGVVVIPRQEAERVVAQLAPVRAAEAALEAKVKAGLRIPDFIAALLRSGRVEEIE
jgi:4-hydroxy-4-methyl-2-oxoglutarate aldolase